MAASLARAKASYLGTRNVGQRCGRRPENRSDRGDHGRVARDLGNRRQILPSQLNEDAQIVADWVRAMRCGHSVLTNGDGPGVGSGADTSAVGVIWGQKWMSKSALGCSGVGDGTAVGGGGSLAAVGVGSPVGVVVSSATAVGSISSGGGMRKTMPNNTAFGPISLARANSTTLTPNLLATLLKVSPRCTTYSQSPATTVTSGAAVDVALTSGVAVTVGVGDDVGVGVADGVQLGVAVPVGVDVAVAVAVGGGVRATIDTGEVVLSRLG